MNKMMSYFMNIQNCSATEDLLSCQWWHSETVTLEWMNNLQFVERIIAKSCFNASESIIYYFIGNHANEGQDLFSMFAFWIYSVT